MFTGPQLNALDIPYHEIRLQDLSSSEAHEMTQSLLGTETIPADLQDFVQERAEGNPFYLEEAVNALIESDTLIQDNGTWKLTRSISESGISSTIHGVISGRLDRLEKESKRILQEASVIGRAFFYEILKRVTELKEQVDQCLSGLENLDLIRKRSLLPELEYIFKHALTQEVVYEGLLKKERQAIHERIGLVIEQLFHDRLPEFYESLAFHFKKGTSTLKAVDYLMKAGEKSLARYAVEESRLYYEEAFDLLAKKPQRSKEEEALLMDVVLHWAHVDHYRGDFKEIIDLLKRHETLAQSLDDKARLGTLYQWWGTALFCRQRYKDSIQYLNSAVKLGEETENEKLIGYACTWLAYSSGELGLMEEAIQFGERGHEMARLHPSDPYLYFRPFGALGYVYWQRGEKRKAHEMAEVLLGHGKRESNVRSLVWGNFIMGLCHFLDGDLPSAIERAEKGTSISQEPWFYHCVRLPLGVFFVMSGRFQEAESVLRGVIAYSDKFGAEHIGTPANVYLGVALIGQGRMGRGFRMIKEAQRLYLENERKGFYALSEYILGKVYLQMVERAAPMSFSRIVKNIGFLVKNVPFASKRAESHFNKAIEVAGEIGAKNTLGQAYLDLGRLHKVKKNREKATEHLSKAIGIFEQSEAKGFLRQAKEALASLG
jgi:tetratricopeptide (TPR) repeat protein